MIRAKVLATPGRVKALGAARASPGRRAGRTSCWKSRDDRPVKPIYEELKRRGILVRYMNYEGSGDGLRISVGTDAEIDRLLAEMGALI